MRKSILILGLVVAVLVCATSAGFCTAAGTTVPGPGNVPKAKANGHIAGSLIFLSRNAAGGTLGYLGVGTIVNGTAFVINSSSSTDTSTVNWKIER